MRAQESDRNAREPSGDRPPASSGLATKLILFVFFSTFVTALIVSWITIQSTAVSLRGTIDRLYPRSLEHAADRIEPWIDGIRCQLEHAKHHASSARSEPIEHESRRGLDGLIVYDAAGTARSRWGLTPDAARSALAAPSRVAAIRLDSGAPALAVATAWESEDDRELVGIVSLERLRPILEQELPADRALLALVDGHGRVVVSAGTAPAGVGLERLAVANSHGALRETEIAGHHVIAAARPLKVLDWHAALVIPFEAAYAPVLAVVKRVFAIDLCIILAFSLLAYRITARIVRPITELSEAARRLARDEDIEISETPSRDEIRLLRQIFFELVKKQRHHRAELDEINRLNSRLQQANEVLNQLSITDGLTKLNNHRYFQDFLTREIRRVERTREPLSMLLLDLDDFKRLNDRLGHAAGDEILSRIAEILNGSVRGSDLCARYGGEEFVVLAPNTDVRGAYALAEKVRTAIAESSFIVDDSLRPLRVTVSIGVAAFRGNRKLFFQKADQALYRAKAGGKNCVVVHDDDLGEDGEPPARRGEAAEPA